MLFRNDFLVDLQINYSSSGLVCRLTAPVSALNVVCIKDGYTLSQHC